MNFVKSGWFRKYLVPGIIFQSVLIAGGYGTGRELVEFFMNFGALGGLVAMTTSAFLTLAVVCAVSFEFARVFKAYDYRTFFKHLLGPGWVLYEICYLVLLLLVLGVVAATSGAILNSLFGISAWFGIVGMMVGVGALIFYGNEAITRALSYWSFVLYAVYAVFMILALVNVSGDIVSALSMSEFKPGYFVSGFKYAWYNLGVIPALLFSVREIETRKEAIGSGILAGLIGIVPAVLLYIAMCGGYPDILPTELPTNFILAKMGILGFQVVFQIVLFGTLIETGTGFIYGVTERISGMYKDKGRQMPKQLEQLVTIGLLILGAVIAQYGLIGLIAQGYGTITWGFFVIFVIPLLTYGVYLIAQHGQKDKPGVKEK
jgi:uncharacterized membrane protein YkvI